MDAATDDYQAGYARRWGHLRDARVRALAWLLDAPDLLDRMDPHWDGRVATLGAPSADTVAWLAALDADPAPLDAALGNRVHTRLGLYAEALMAFYFAHQGTLLAHGLQVCDGPRATVGEFDFLLDDGAGGALHIEFATKFYLLREGIGGHDGFVGPNLADTLGRKMRKVFEKQLALGTHPAAQGVLPRPVTSAQALVKGWLFYPAGTWATLGGIAPVHCRGFWCALAQLDTVAGEGYVVLPRLQWLAPFQGDADTTVLNRAQLAEELAARFAHVQEHAPAPAPVLVAVVRTAAQGVVEVARGFVVPDDWGSQPVR